MFSKDNNTVLVIFFGFGQKQISVRFLCNHPMRNHILWQMNQLVSNSMFNFVGWLIAREGCKM